MISTNFYSQLTVCPVCHGYGEDKMGAKKNLPCKECGGMGVFLAQMEQSYIWTLPKYVDFGARKRIFYAKICLLIFLIIFLFVIYYLINNLIINRISLPKFYGPDST